MDFKKPNGVNFHCVEELSTEKVSNMLCSIAEFLQNNEPYTQLFQYEDWLEHDGLMYFKNKLDYPTLFQMIGTPEQLLKSMQGDECVHVGILPKNTSWYLRFYVYWNNEGTSLYGRFDITIEEFLVSNFRDKLLTNIKLNDEPSDVYFNRISE